MPEGIIEITVALIGALIGAIATILAVIIPYMLSQRRISDKEMFWKWRIAFDRRAFKGHYVERSLPYGGHPQFKEAIKDTIKAVNTGVIVGVDTERGKGRAYIRNKDWRSKMDEVERHLSKISDINDEIEKNFRDNKPIEDLKLSIDNERDKIIKTLNEIWKSLKIPELPVPTETPLWNQQE